MITVNKLTFNEAICDATSLAMEKNSKVIVIGEGVTDPGRVFGTTNGLVEKFGTGRVIESPIAENGVTGICLGLALHGYIPIIVHQRCDFSLYAFDQIINNIAKWRSMFSNNESIPIIIRMIVGQGWGQAQQHSQNLQATLAHFPGLRVIAPSTARDAKGMLLNAIEGNDPVVLIEHRWCQNFIDEVPNNYYLTPYDPIKVAEGTSLTVVTSSYWTIELLRTIKLLEIPDNTIEIINLNQISKGDWSIIYQSLKKTKRLLIIDGDWSYLSISSEILAQVFLRGIQLDAPPLRLTFPDVYPPAASSSFSEYYITVEKIANKLSELLGVNFSTNKFKQYLENKEYDRPDYDFEYCQCYKIKS